MHVCVHTTCAHMFTGVHNYVVHVYTQLCGNQGSVLGVIRQQLSTFFSEYLAGQGVPLCPLSIQSYTTVLGFLPLVLGVGLQSSGLCCKHFASESLSQAPDYKDVLNIIDDRGVLQRGTLQRKQAE